MLPIMTVLVKPDFLAHEVCTLILGPTILIRDLYDSAWKQSSDPLGSFYNVVPVTLLSKKPGGWKL